MSGIMEFATGEWGTILLILGVIGLAMTLLFKLPKSNTTRNTVKVLSIFSVGFVLIAGYMAPLFWVEPVDFQDKWSNQMTVDVTAADWADPLGVADADLWDAAQSDCNNAEHICHVLVTATRVGTGINTMAPMEALIGFKTTRDSNNPDKTDDEDFATPNIRFSYSHATWTNTTSGDTFDAIYDDADGNAIVYWEQGLTEGATMMASGQTMGLDPFQPGDSLNYYLGFKFNPVGFGADGQTAGVSSITLTGEIATYSFTVIVSVITIA